MSALPPLASTLPGPGGPLGFVSLIGDVVMGARFHSSGRAGDVTSLVSRLFLPGDREHQVREASVLHGVRPRPHADPPRNPL